MTSCSSKRRQRHDLETLEVHSAAVCDERSEGPGSGPRGRRSPASWASPQGPGLAPSRRSPGVEGDPLFSCVNAGVLRHRTKSQKDGAR